MAKPFFFNNEIYTKLFYVKWKQQFLNIDWHLDGFFVLVTKHIYE